MPKTNTNKQMEKIREREREREREKGGSPGLVVMRGDSCPEDHGFESQHNILDGHFSHIFAVNICLRRRK